MQVMQYLCVSTLYVYIFLRGHSCNWTATYMYVYIQEHGYGKLWGVTPAEFLQKLNKNPKLPNYIFQLYSLRNGSRDNLHAAYLCGQFSILCWRKH